MRYFISGGARSKSVPTDVKPYAVEVVMAVLVVVRVVVVVVRVVLVVVMVVVVVVVLVRVVVVLAGVHVCMCVCMWERECNLVYFGQTVAFNKKIGQAGIPSS